MASPPSGMGLLPLHSTAPQAIMDQSLVCMGAGIESQPHFCFDSVRGGELNYADGLWRFENWNPGTPCNRGLQLIRKKGLVVNKSLGQERSSSDVNHASLVDMASKYRE
ncbi:hypothetical protein H6P81_013701 [Aristolochia fimbriata]|uniref:Uncharacterized protein n=1 Tax=Aristolochia fimbriata TaxID=158543 RepID=A0AAV7EK31_ARIFI|nr:hypothetical protein H6P81_013701 [Aristolochia fimbriata]